MTRLQAPRALVRRTSLHKRPPARTAPTCQSNSDEKQDRRFERGSCQSLLSMLQCVLQKKKTKAGPLFCFRVDLFQETPWDFRLSGTFFCPTFALPEHITEESRVVSTCRSGGTASGRSIPFSFFSPLLRSLFSPSPSSQRLLLFHTHGWFGIFPFVFCLALQFHNISRGDSSVGAPAIHIPLSFLGRLQEMLIYTCMLPGLRIFRALLPLPTRRRT